MLVKYEKKNVWSKLGELLSFLTKKKKHIFFYNNFWQIVDAILEDI